MMMEIRKTLSNHVQQDRVAPSLALSIRGQPDSKQYRVDLVVSRKKCILLLLFINQCIIFHM